MGFVTSLEYEAKFMLGPIQAAHTGVRFRPNAKIYLLQAAAACSSGKLKCMSPVHKNEDQRPRAAAGPQHLQGVSEKTVEFGGRHLACALHEIRMMILS